MSGSLEPNISPYATIQGPPPPQPVAATNPFAMLQSIQGLQKGAQDIQQQGLQMRAQQAIGRAVQGATNPTTGQVDEDKAAAAVAADPDSAYMANEFRSAQVARKLQSAQMSVDQIDTALKQHQYFGAKLAQLYDDPDFRSASPNASKNLMDKISDAGKSMVANGLDPKVFIQEVSGMNSDMTPQQLQQKVGALIATNETNANALKILHPDVDVINTGDAIHTLQRSPLANPALINGQGLIAPMAMPTAQQGEPGPPLLDSDMNKHPQTLGQFAQLRGVPTASPGFMPEGSAQALGAAFGPGPAAQGFAGLRGGPSALDATVGRPVPEMKTTSGFVPRVDPAIIPAGSDVTEAGPGQQKQANDLVNHWNDNRAALSATLEKEQSLSRYTQMEQQALGAIKSGAGVNEVRQKLAQGVEGIGNLLGEKDGVPFRNLANTLLDKAAGQSGGQALATLQSYEQLVFRQTADLVQSSFANEGTQHIFEQALAGANSASKEPGSIITAANLIRSTYDFHQKMQDAARAWNATNGVNSNWDNFNSDWLKHATGLGYGTTTPMAGGALAVPGDQKGLDTGASGPAPKTHISKGWVFVQDKNGVYQPDHKVQ